MRVARERIEGELKAIVISGDGITGSEYTILKEMSERHDGMKTLWFPGPSPKPSKPLVTPGAGLKALRALKTLKRFHTNFLFLVDREHFKTDKEQNEIEDTLRQFGINDISIHSLSKGSLIIKAKIGNCKITVCAAIFGEIKLEEEIVKLIDCTRKIKVQPEKNDIERICKEHETSLKKIVKEASSKDLATAFPNLTQILTKIGLDC